MLGIRLYLAQRLTAMLMAPLVLLHLGVMVYAVQGGLSSSEILGRTQGSLLWGLVYGLFVAAVSVHAAIGLRVVIYEWFGIHGAILNWFTGLVTLFLFVMGGSAVYAVVMS